MDKLIQYQYQILRYSPDKVRGEFINIGIAVYSPNEKFLKAAFPFSIVRAQALFPALNLVGLQTALERLGTSLLQKTGSMREWPDALPSVISSVFVKDDSSLSFTEMKMGVDTDLNHAFEDLLQRMVITQSDIFPMPFIATSHSLGLMSLLKVSGGVTISKKKEETFFWGPSKMHAEVCSLSEHLDCDFTPSEIRKISAPYSKNFKVGTPRTIA